jgi:ribonuclease BN (tRNA processing enzyme)
VNTSGLVWTTLGTAGGPIPNPVRAQPANLLGNAEGAILVDAGDGVVDQLGKAGVDLGTVGAIFLSHLHIDHTAGLLGVLGRRLQTRITRPLTVYGPSGTRREIERIESSLEYLAGLMASNGRTGTGRSCDVGVVEISDGASITVGPVTVAAATNSHYGFPSGSEDAARFQSLSFRFDMPDRSIVYTGDTGPSDNVARLARGADVLVSEIIDPAAALAQIKATRQDLPVFAEPFLTKHFAKEHLSADEVGLLARTAEVGAVVLTHNSLAGTGFATALAAIATHFGGTIAFADDLDTW